MPPRSASPQTAGGDLKIAKFRQDSHYLSPARDRIHQPIRSHNEGLNGHLKGAYMDIGNPLHRRAPGQVAQTILIAIMVAIGILDILDTWLYEPPHPIRRHPSPRAGIERPSKRRRSRPIFRSDGISSPFLS
ncbi:hypothetical protein ACFVQ0_18675 [Streptomyces sp. NPDC057900]|uniref:hypothetical protein n=1 Tax=Streptomyces sp. NPDC057900 TaxID=3346274 RepID=UPI0036EF0753